MYLVPLKTALVNAMREVFDNEYPEEDFRADGSTAKVYVSIEYPDEKMHYPGIWVDYSDTQPLQIAGVDHVETQDPEQPNDPYADIDEVRKFTRWRFQGYATYTVSALTSLERDRLYDELVRIFAFGRVNPLLRKFRDSIETNPLVAVTMDFDTIEATGVVAAPGTPWGTDEVIYERTINIQLIGEFVSNEETGELVLLSEIILIQEQDMDLVPAPSQSGMGGWH